MSTGLCCARPRCHDPAPEPGRSRWGTGGRSEPRPPYSHCTPCVGTLPCQDALEGLTPGAACGGVTSLRALGLGGPLEASPPPPRPARPPEGPRDGVRGEEKEGGCHGSPPDPHSPLLQPRLPLPAGWPPALSCGAPVWPPAASQPCTGGAGR